MCWIKLKLQVFVHNYATDPTCQCDLLLTPFLYVAIFFDWDDTFLSYWHLSCLGVKMNASVGAIPECVGQELEDLELRVERAIEKALSLTPWVYIVSNSEDGWVRRSAQV